MMPRCRAIKSNGERCKATVAPGVEYCWAHDPVNARERQRIASRAGRSRPNREIGEIKQRIREVIEDVRVGDLNRSIGAVVFQGYNTLLRAVEIERKVRELDEQEERIAMMERRLQRATG